MLEPIKMNRYLNWTALTALTLAGGAEAGEIRLGLSSSAGLGCQVAGVHAGMQENRLGGYIQAAYCNTGVEQQPGGLALGGTLTFDLFQKNSFGAYVLAGANSNPVGDPSIYGGLGARYGIPNTRMELFVEGAVQRTETIIQPLIAPRMALGISYVQRDIDFQKGLGGESRPSNIGLLGTSGLNVDQNAGGAETSPEQSKETCDLTSEQDEANAISAARSAANSALASAAAAYGALFGNITYSVDIGSADITGNRATVDGSINISAVNKATGKEVGDSYNGVVNLVRSGCGWRAVGYERK